MGEERLDPTKMALRNLRREDLEAVVRIDSRATGYLRNLYFERKFKRIFGEDSQLLLSLVAEYEGQMVGYIMGEANTGEYGIPEPVASVDTIGVDPEFKRAGIGQMLLEEYCAMAAKAGIELMTTLVSQDYPDLIQFFQAHDFKPAKMLALDRNLAAGRL